MGHEMRALLPHYIRIYGKEEKGLRISRSSIVSTQRSLHRYAPVPRRGSVPRVKGKKVKPLSCVALQNCISRLTEIHVDKWRAVDYRVSNRVPLKAAALFPAIKFSTNTHARTHIRA